MSKQILKQSVGIDVSKDCFDACFCQKESGQAFRVISSRKFNYNANGLHQMHLWAQRHHSGSCELHLVMEATGVYYEELAYFLQSQAYRVSVMLPNRTNAYARSLDYKSKTDRIDAKMLAQLSLERDLPQWIPVGDSMLTIKRLCRERAALSKSIAAFRNRLHAKEYGFQPLKSGIRRTKTSIRHFTKQIADIELLIQQTIAKDPKMAQKVDYLCSIPGVGMMTAVTIIAETNGFALFKNKAQVVSYAGLDVVHHESGTSVKAQTHISKKGNSHLRKALYFPAISSVRCDSNLAEIYNKVFEKTKVKMKAYVAVQRKLLVLIYTIYKNDTPYNPDMLAKKQ